MSIFGLTPSATATTEAHGRFQPSIGQIIVATIAAVLITALVVTIADRPAATESRTDPETTAAAPTLKAAPVLAAPEKIHVEWVKIGSFRNGREAGVPSGHDLVYVPADLIENLPPGATGVLAFPTERGTILYTVVETEPWVLTYWRTEEVPSASLGLKSR